MNELDEIYIRIFIVIPLLVYTGYCIMNEQSHTSSFFFHVIVLLMLALVLYFHMKYLIKAIRRIFTNQKYQKEFGVFLLFLAVFLFTVCLHDLHNYRKRSK